MTIPPRPSTANRIPAKDVRRELFLKKNKSYASLPSLQQWQTDTKPGRIGGRASDPMLRNIDDLIKELQTARGGAHLQRNEHRASDPTYRRNHALFRKRDCALRRSNH